MLTTAVTIKMLQSAAVMVMIKSKTMVIMQKLQLPVELTAFLTLVTM